MITKELAPILHLFASYIVPILIFVVLSSSDGKKQAFWMSGEGVLFLLSDKWLVSLLEY